MNFWVLMFVLIVFSCGAVDGDVEMDAEEQLIGSWIHIYSYDVDYIDAMHLELEFKGSIVENGDTITFMEEKRVENFISSSMEEGYWWKIEDDSLIYYENSIKDNIGQLSRMYGSAFEIRQDTLKISQLLIRIDDRGNELGEYTLYSKYLRVR